MTLNGVKCGAWAAALMLMCLVPEVALSQDAAIKAQPKAEQGDAATAKAKTEVAEVLGGKWVIIDKKVSGFGRCSVTLGKTLNSAGSYDVEVNNCKEPVSAIKNWDLRNNQLVLLDAANKIVVQVGGNRSRLSGETAEGNMPLILERSDIADLVDKQRRSIQCYYLGYSAQCAKPEQFAAPNGTVEKPAPVTVLTKLNVRTQPRNEATVEQVITPNSCVSALGCDMASDGLWCKISHEGKQGWIKKQTVRASKWPIVTFVNGC